MQVFSTKGSGTARPFVRLAPTDLTLYQALVDALAPSIEGALAPRTSVFAYRQSLDPTDNAFEGSPRWEDFIFSVRGLLEDGWYSHALTADVSSYFVYVSIDELERRLLGIGAPPDVVRDLSGLLSSWHMMGIHGLPQGVQPSAPLGNFYLNSLDELVAEAGYESRRYMDDFWVFATSFSEARRAQDLIEQHLYELRLTLGGDKSRIFRASTALAETQTAKERIERRRDSILAEVLEAADPYEDDVPQLDPDALDSAAVLSEYGEIIDGIRSDVYPTQLRPRLIELYRQLEALGDPAAVADTPDVLQRFPDLTSAALRYVANIANCDREAAVNAFLEVLDHRRFHRDQELLLIFRAALWLPNRCSDDLGDVLADYARDADSPLLQARALLAWGAHSPKESFDAADQFWGASDTEWRTYCLVSIQDKEEAERDSRFDRWSGEGRFLRAVADAIKERPFQWRRL